ncbi:MAG: hypothetical protein ACR2NL_05100 [Acidimicrobiia bacterium]
MQIRLFSKLADHDDRAHTDKDLFAPQNQPERLAPAVVNKKFTGKSFRRIREHSHE